jgi:mannose-6-phosphate isomerase-like protein (cupin superfamily)
MAQERAWAVARLDEIPDDHPPGWWDSEAHSEGFGARWHPVRRHFGIQGFGVAASGADTGQELIVPHTEMGPTDPDSGYVGGQEEIYLVIRGAARFVLDGEALDVAAGDIVYVPPQVHRAATATADDTLVFGVGGAPGKPYHGLDPSTHTPAPNPGSVAARRAAGGS